MPSSEEEPPVVAFPAPVERRLRLGPFPSARDALKFVSYAAAGALLAPFVSPYAWLPIVAIGFAVSVWRPEGGALDERFGRWTAWSLRRIAGGAMTSRTRPAGGAGAFLRLGLGRYATVLRTSGTPVAYRPPAELQRIFLEFGELLRASDGVLVLRAGSMPLAPDRLRPADGARGTRDEAARAGYGELVTVLCRRRLVRRVEIVLFSSESSRDAAAHLEARTRRLAVRLEGLGLHPLRLRGRALAEAAHRLGWPAGGRVE